MGRGGWDGRNRMETRKQDSRAQAQVAALAGSLAMHRQGHLQAAVRGCTDPQHLQVFP